MTVTNPLVYYDRKINIAIKSACTIKHFAT